MVYRLALFFYALALRLAALFGHHKARLWLAGREDLPQQLADWQRRRSTAPVLWLHCASLGEFEQGRPLAEAFLAAHPDYQLVLSFFSPSGYEPRKNYALASAVFYLPLDSRSNAKLWLDSINPTIAIFIKYEFWYYYLNALQQRRIPTYLASAIFRSQQPFFRWYGGFFRQMLGCFSHIFVQNRASLDLLQSIGIQHASIAGDTRFDRVWAVRTQAKSFPLLESFAQGHRLIVAGSTWPPDEQLLIDYYNNKIHNTDWKLVIVPHEIDPAHLQQLETRLAGLPYARWTQADAQAIPSARILIIDTIGMLSSLYRYASVAYIGGGFGKGIHNTLEAAVYGVPVLFGPRYHKFAEAVELQQRRIGFVINNNGDLEAVLKALQNAAELERIRLAATAYFEEQVGASQRIVQAVEVG